MISGSRRRSEPPRLRCAGTATCAIVGARVEVDDESVIRHHRQSKGRPCAGGRLPADAGRAWSSC